jgi:hypothetical protein
MKRTYISDRGNNDVRIMTYDANRDVFIEGTQHETIDEAASILFQRLYYIYKHSNLDSGADEPEASANALDSARTDTSAALPNGTTGMFDDEYLTFTNTSN